MPVSPGAPEGYYHMAGYRPCGARALRIDMLERLADLIRPLDARAGFEATQDMLSITGCTHEQFAELMAGLGFQVEKGERPKQPKPARTEAAVAADASSAAVAEVAGAAALAACSRAMRRAARTQKRSRRMTRPRPGRPRTRRRT